MPGVLLTECMAQTTGWLVNALCGFTAMPILAGVKEAKFRTCVFPGDELKFEATVLHEGSGYTVGEVQGTAAAATSCARRRSSSHRAVPKLRSSASRVGMGGAARAAGQGAR